MLCHFIIFLRIAISQCYTSYFPFLDQEWWLRGEVLESTLVLPFTNYVTYLIIEIEDKNSSPPCVEDKVDFVESIEHKSKCSIFSMVADSMNLLKILLNYILKLLHIYSGTTILSSVLGVKIADNL